MNHAQTNAGDSKPAKKRMSPFKVGLIIVGLLLALLARKVALVLMALPTPSVDYAAELNRISKPADYDSNQNAHSYYTKAFERLVEMPDIVRAAWSALPADMNEEELHMLKEWLALNADAIHYLKVAASRRYYWIQRSEGGEFWARFPEHKDALGFENSSEIRKFNSAGNFLEAQIRLRAYEGETKAALEDIVDLYKIGSHLCGPKTLTEQLLGIILKSTATRLAFSIIDGYQIDSKTLAFYQRQLEYEASQGEEAIDFRAEQLFINDLIQLTFTDDGTGNGNLIPRQFSKYDNPLIIGSLTEADLVRLERGRYARALWIALAGPDRPRTVRIVDKYFDFVDSIRRETPWQLHSRGIDPQKQTAVMLRHYYTKETMHTLWPVLERYHQQRAQETALIATVAILRHKAEKDQLPEHLQELISTGYLKELPMDPYSDGPLVYERVGDDFVLYSVGADFDDDGGVRSDWGEGDTGDQVFWPVERPKAEQTRLTRRVRRVK